MIGGATADIIFIDKLYCEIFPADKPTIGGELLVLVIISVGNLLIC